MIDASESRRPVTLMGVQNFSECKVCNDNGLLSKIKTLDYNSMILE